MLKIKEEKESSLHFLLTRSTYKKEMSQNLKVLKCPLKMMYYLKKSVLRQEITFNNFSNKSLPYYQKSTNQLLEVGSILPSIISNSKMKNKTKKIEQVKSKLNLHITYLIYVALTYAYFVFEILIQYRS